MTISDHLNQETGYPKPQYTFEQLQDRVKALEDIIQQLLELQGIAVYQRQTTTGIDLVLVNTTPQ